MNGSDSLHDFNDCAPKGHQVIFVAISGSLNEMKWVKVPWFLAWGRG